VAIHPGDILAGYRVTRLLGRGGMGEVWAAVDDGGHAPDGPRDVAIKVLLARAAMKPDLVRRFEREARIASAIKSPYVCQLLEVAQADDGAHLLVFEHLSGESLADRLKREQYLPFSEVGPILDDVLQGLVAAHEAGVVHRDLKPGNIFLVHQRTSRPPEAYAPPSGGFGFGADAAARAAGGPSPYPARRERAKILDFGISKLTRREASSGEREPTLTDFNATLGSFAYMAPEQVRGAARADERADIYSVGAVAFRALSGRLPFEGTTAHYLVAMKLEHQAPSLAEITGEQWPAGVERFLERALERRRELRFSTAGEALEVWRSIQPSAIQRGPASSPGASQPPIPPAPRSAPVPAPAKAPVRAARPAGPPSAAIPAPTKPVVTIYGKRQVLPIMEMPPPAAPVAPPAPPAPPPAPPAPGGAVPPPPPARPPMQSYQIVDDNPTEVDGPPTMTIDGLPPEPTDSARKRKTGRR
jgi:eukaryotic-like serine/threonine-protein kinase